jgi:hypothetical protein
MRCQAIKRDGLQCNYCSKPALPYCGVHRHYTPVEETISGVRMTRVAERNPTINYIMNVMNVTSSIALTIFRETTRLEMEHAKNKKIHDLVNSFKSFEISDDNCCICISKPEDMVVTPCCKKEFCSSCLKKWVSVNRSCPTCRNKENFSMFS